MCIKVFHGKDPDCETNIIYATPEIYIIPIAESMLKKIVAIIDDSAYEGYYSDIELIAQEIKKNLAIANRSLAIIDQLKANGI